MSTPKNAPEPEARVKRTVARHGQLGHSSGVKNFFRGVLSAVLAVCVSAVLVSAYALWDLGSSVETVKLSPSGPKVANAKALEGSFNVLIVGSDSRAGQKSVTDGEEGELNDVTMMLHVSEDHKRATVVSFPRDTMLPIPSCPGPDGEENYYSAMSEQQLNSTLSYGLPCTVRTIEELTGASIPYAGLVSFDGVINMSNAIGGVDVCLAQPIVDPKTDLDLPAGDVTLVGREALQFLRTRAGVGDGGDVSRISNQQVFLSSLVRKVKSSETLADPVKVYGLAKAAVENMTLSDNMASVGFMQSVATTLQTVELDKMTFVQYPTIDHPYQPGRLLPDTVAGDLLMQKVLADEDFTLQGTGVAAQQAEPDPSTDQGNSGDGTQGENTTDAQPVDPASPAPAESDTGAGADPGTGDGTTPPEETVLPENVTGQVASDVTCSSGRTLF